MACIGTLAFLIVQSFFAIMLLTEGLGRNLFEINVVRISKHTYAPKLTPSVLALPLIRSGEPRALQYLTLGLPCRPILK